MEVIRPQPPPITRNVLLLYQIPGESRAAHPSPSPALSTTLGKGGLPSLP